MRERRILIFGKNGQLSWELRRRLNCLGRVSACGSDEVDFTKPDLIRSALHAVKPQVIVNAVAYTAVDKAESDIEAATAINAAAPAVLAEEAKRLGSLLVHYSTDYVFDGTKNGRWLESDTPHPLGVYGKTKLEGDLAIEASGCRHLIFRTTWVYGARGSNFLLTMLRLAKERSELRVVDDQIGSPTSSECIAQATAHVLAQALSPAATNPSDQSGIYNMTSSGETSWHGFAKAILTGAAARWGNPLPHLIPIPSSDYPTPAKRPKNSRLDCSKLEDAFGVSLPSWEESLELILESLAASSQQPNPRS